MYARYIYIYIFTHVYTYVCVYIYICIYISMNTCGCLGGLLGPYAAYALQDLYLPFWAHFPAHQGIAVLRYRQGTHQAPGTIQNTCSDDHAPARTQKPITGREREKLDDALFHPDHSQDLEFSSTLRKEASEKQEVKGTMHRCICSSSSEAARQCLRQP